MALEERLEGIEGKFAQMIEQVKQWRENRKEFDHYLANVARIALGYQPIDYTVISHENKLIHSELSSEQPNRIKDSVLLLDWTEGYDSENKA